MMSPIKICIQIILLVLSIIVPGAKALAQEPVSQSTSPELVFNEQQTVYLTNLKRAEHGLPPLRWNYQLTEAARWFAWDSVENRPGGYCGHQDTNGQYPIDRASLFGYYGLAGAENAYCGYVMPQQAVDGWYASEGHRQNMLDPHHREIGLGYYQRTSDGRGYVVQMFGRDAAYPPVIINQEAISTTNQAVNLYIYGSDDGDKMTGLGSPTEMIISNRPCFDNALWEVYQTQRSWNLEAGQGWRSVYVKTRDASGRSTLVSDTIYLGSNLSNQALSLDQAATRTDSVRLYDLDSNLPFMQFSLGWLIEMEKGTLWWGSGEVVADADASAGQAFRLRPGNGDTFLWATPTDYPRDVDSQAYFRLKVTDNASSALAGRISVETNGTERDVLELKGTDFAAPNVYQEFPLDFIQADDPNNPFLKLQISRLGSATVYVDRVTAFTAPEAFQGGKIWTVPGQNYRGRTVWVRYTDNNGTFSPITEVDSLIADLHLSKTALNFLGDGDRVIPDSQTIQAIVSPGCDQPSNLSANSNASWLEVLPQWPELQIRVDPAGLSNGTYQGTVTIDAGPGIKNSPQFLQVTYTQTDDIKQTFIPLLLRP
ncbi:MAG: CAP domain-containing protein [Anaerolineales bacterium]|nr:CAP domain-containing protein [Anaerolineales bacterium]